MNCRRTYFFLRASVLGTGLGLAAVAYRAGFHEFSLSVLLAIIVLYLWLVKRERYNTEDNRE